MLNLYQGDKEPIRVHIIQKTSKRRAYSISFDEEEIPAKSPKDDINLKIPSFTSFDNFPMPQMP